jgi:hypothetical protein
MTKYNQKSVLNLKQDWYLALPRRDKQMHQVFLQNDRIEQWKNKPIERTGYLTCKTETLSITKGKKYLIINHFCTLINTIYGSTWHSFVTIKNDYCYTIKVNINKFETVYETLERIKEELGL